MVPSSLKQYGAIIKELSDRLIQAQQPIRVLDAIKWDHSIKEVFFQKKFKVLPEITPEYYHRNTLPYDPENKTEEFYNIEREVRRRLGQLSPIGKIMARMCREYREVLRLVKKRGQHEFSKLSQELYGSADDAFFAGAPTLKDLATMISKTLDHLPTMSDPLVDEKKYTSEQAVEILQSKMSDYFKDASRTVRVTISDGILSDSSAGADVIKIRQGALFSERELRVLEVHEGWTHIGTTLNGLEQPYCTFLSKGPPSSTFTQEGLAIILEIFTFASYPDRVKRLTNRIMGIQMAESGANFIEVFNFYLSQGLTEDEAYSNTVRVFRGSLPDEGPFTKDLVYSKGFILIYNFMQFAIQRGRPDRIPLLFLGKTTLEDIRTYAELVDEGVLVPAKFLPPQFKDLGALSAWMCYSNFLNRLNLTRIAIDFKDIL